ncbi:MAG: hypothetical protein KF773_41710 [Deltaproteobacteria bacterium]|nr:hypothetical protein [Deltaproteobacteria bacterium]MCW5806496.1 hypothetical protein [Deltaproteobacteria bacterium]
MKLVEAETTGPVEGDDEIVTPPRPWHRAVSVSLLFTLTVLTGTVVAIYTIFPARHNVLLTEAVERHRDAAPGWELTSPEPGVVQAWALGLLGKDAPLPPPSAVVVGVRGIEVLERRAALVGLMIGADRVTYLCQHARSNRYDTERVDGDVHAVAWRHGAYDCVAAGPEATVAHWLSALR